MACKLTFFLWVFLLLPTHTFAFTLNNNIGAAFDQDEVPVSVAAHTCQYLGVTNDELLSMAEEAGELFWNRVHTSSLELVRGSLLTVDGAYQTGLACSNSPSTSCDVNTNLATHSGILISCNQNLINFNSNNQVLAVTIPNRVSGQAIQASLILLNDDAGNSFQSLSREEKVSVLAHEIGHAVGLGHSSLAKNLMYFETRASRRALGQDDVDGITYLYPMEQPFDTCSAAPLFPSKNDGDHSGHGHALVLEETSSSNLFLRQFLLAFTLFLGLGFFFNRGAFLRN